MPPALIIAEAVLVPSFSPKFKLATAWLIGFLGDAATSKEYKVNRITCFSSM